MGTTSSPDVYLKSFRDTISVFNSLDSEKARQFSVLIYVYTQGFISGGQNSPQAVKAFVLLKRMVHDADTKVLFRMQPGSY